MPAAPRALVILAAVWATLSSPAAFAEDGSSPANLLDSALRKLNLKATPADPAPDFVVKTRPDTANLDYIQRPVAHKVSPIPTKTPDEVEAAKEALDQARDRQLAPPRPVQLGKTKAAKAKASPATPAP